MNSGVVKTIKEGGTCTLWATSTIIKAMFHHANNRQGHSQKHAIQVPFLTQLDGSSLIVEKV